MCLSSHASRSREGRLFSFSASASSLLCSHLLCRLLSSAASSAAFAYPPIAIAYACLRVEANVSRKVFSKCHFHTAFIYPSIRERKAGVALSLCSERGTPHSRFLYNRRIPHSISHHSTYTLQFRTLTKPVDDMV